MNDSPIATIKRVGFSEVEITVNGQSTRQSFDSIASTKEFVSKSWDLLMQKYGRDNVEFIGL